MLLMIIYLGLALEIIGLVMALIRHRNIAHIGGLMMTFGGIFCSLSLLFCFAQLFLFGGGGSLKQFLTTLGLALAGGAIYLFVGFPIGEWVERRTYSCPERKNRPNKKGRRPESEGIHPVVIILIAALAVKALSNILNIVLGWALPMPLEWFDFTVTVLLLVYLVICALCMTPLGLLAYTVIAAIGCAGVYVAVWSLGVMVAGMFMAGIVSALLSGVVITGIISGGAVIITSVTAITYIPFLLPMIAVAPAGAVIAAGGGLAMAADAGNSSVDSAASVTKKILNTVINIVLIFAVCIPILTAFTGIHGIFRSKPGEIFGLQFLNRHNLITADTSLDKVFGLGSGELREFHADMDIFYGDNYNACQITEEFNLDADNTTIAILHDGVLHIYDSTNMNVLAQEACPIKDGENTVIMNRTYETYVLGDEELFIVNHAAESDPRHYFRKDYPWRGEYLAMSENEQMDHIYHLLMDSESHFSAPLQDAALVKLSAQHGQLVSYDLEKKTAVFARKNEDGTVTFLYQTSPEERNELATVSVYTESKRIPWFWDSTSKCVNFLTGISDIAAVYTDGYVTDSYNMHKEREIISMNSVHNYNDEYCIVDMTPDRMYVFNYPNEQWVNMDLDEEVTEHCTGILQIGNSIYSFWYPEESFLRKYTYLKDAADKKDWSFKKRYIESHYHGLQYIYRDLDETFGSGN